MLSWIVAMKPPAIGAFGIWEGTWVAFEPIMPRCSAAVAIAWPCVPKVVVRLGRRTTCRADQDDPRVSARQVVRRPLVNDLGPECEVKTLTSLPASTAIRSAGFQPKALRKFAANAEGEKALAIRPHPNPLPRGEGGTIAADQTVDARLDLETRQGLSPVLTCTLHATTLSTCATSIATPLKFPLSPGERVGVRAGCVRFFALLGCSGNSEGNSL